MEDEGVESEGLGLSIRWPKGYERPSAETADPAEDAPPETVDEAEVQTAPAKKRPAPRRSRARKPAALETGPLPAAEPADGTAPRTAPPSGFRPETSPPDPAPPHRMDQLSNDVSALVVQVRSLAEQTAALGVLMEEQLNAPPVGEVPDDGDFAVAGHGDEALVATVSQGLAAGEQAVRRVEAINSALAVEMAEVGQAISDQMQTTARSLTGEIHDGLQRLAVDIEAVGESTADAVAQVALVTEQFEAFQQQLEALRRRLPARARATPVLDRAALTELADLIADRLRSPAAPARAGRNQRRPPG